MESHNWRSGLVTKTTVQSKYENISILNETCSMPLI